jgi:hypothetical protein
MSRVTLPSKAYVGGLPRAPISVGGRSGSHKQGWDTIDTTGETSHHCMPVMVDSAADIRARYSASEWLVNPLPSGVLLVDSALVMPSSHRIIPFSFNGEKTLRLDSSRGLSTPWLDSDPLAVQLFRDEKPYVRTFWRAESDTVPVGLDWYSDTADLQWGQTGDHLLDPWSAYPPGPGPAYNNSYYLAPNALLADHVENSLGDLRIAGYGDSNMANAWRFTYHERAINNRFSYYRICAAGAACGALTVETSPLAGFIGGCNTLIYAMGTNSEALPYGTLKPIIQADLAAARRRGIQTIIGCTMPPATTSSDSWTTVVNQAVQPINEPTRLALNADWRNGGFDADAVCDATSYVEVNSASQFVLNGGLWMVVGGVPFGNNVHYQELGMAAAAVGQAAVLNRLADGERDFIVQNSALVG